MTRLGWRAARALTALALLAGACGGGDVGPEAAAPVPDPTPTAVPYAWGEEAEIWSDQMFPLLQDRGGGAFEWFWDADIEFDYRTMAPGVEVLTGDEALLFMQRVIPQRSLAAISLGPGYVSVDGLVNANWIDWGPSGLDTFFMTKRPAIVVNVLDPIGSDGAERMLSALSAKSWIERRIDTARAEDAVAIAEAWIDAWSGDTAVAGALYATDATLLDSVAGTTASGSDAVLDLLTSSDATWSITTIDGAVPAVFPISANWGVLDGLVLFAHGLGAAECPGKQAVVLTIADGRITTEERYWDVPSARRCLRDTDLPSGWWNTVDLEFTGSPTEREDLDTRTGIVETGGVSVEIYNGTPALDEFVAWGLERFTEVGLEAPDVASVTFTSYSELCTDAAGRTIWNRLSTDMYLCLAEPQVCEIVEGAPFRSGAVRTLLHELAHAWMVANLDDDTREDFTDLIELAVWASPDVPWSEQAREHAADVIAWGISGLELCEVLSPGDGASPEVVDSMVERFELLTDVSPNRTDHDG